MASKVAILMGSKSDLPLMTPASELLDKLMRKIAGAFPVAHAASIPICCSTVAASLTLA